MDIPHSQNFDDPNINYEKIIDHVEKQTKSNYVSYVNSDTGKLVANLANYGGKSDTIVKLERNGEYYGIAVRLLENVKPLLTSRYIIRIIRRLSVQDYMSSMELLFVTSVDEIAYILDAWIKNATENYDDYANVFSFHKNNYPQYNEWIKTVTHDPINAKMAIVEIGHNTVTNNSVVPVEWTDKIFNGARELHAAMDKLDTRIGKTPVTYAVIYSMIIQSKNIIHPHLSNLNTDEKKKILFMVDIIDNKFYTLINPELDDMNTNKYQYVDYPDFVIAFVQSDILNTKSPKKSKDVGLLVSQLQKSIRRGRYCSKALLEAISLLNISPNYNLPEHGFLRVSSAKQLVWRLFITIFEDSCPYVAHHQLQLIDLMMLVLITNRAQEYCFTNNILRMIKITALIAQYNDSPQYLMNWRDYPAQTDIQLLNSIVISSIHTSIALAINNLIMMTNDNIMLSKYYSITQNYPYHDIPIDFMDNIDAILERNYYLHNNKCYELSILASFDQHCKTHVILYYQSTLSTPAKTTRQISNYIWDVSSGYNIRVNNSELKIDQELLNVQQFLFDVHYSIPTTNNNTNDDDSVTENEAHDDINDKNVDINMNMRRTSFLMLFGIKFRSGNNEVILAGTVDEPYRLKNKNNWDYSSSNIIFPQQSIDLRTVNPPIGYKWKFNGTHVIVEIKDNTPYINNKKIPWYDASSMLEKINLRKKYKLCLPTQKIINNMLCGLSVDFKSVIFFRLSHISRRVEWISHDCNYDYELFKLVYTKFLNSHNNIVMIGPVMRSGHKMQNSISYTYEGRIWGVFCVLKYLYPELLKIHGGLNFKITSQQIPEYIELMSSLEYVLFKPQPSLNILPHIQTQLWDHQKNSVTKITNGYMSGKFGYGDASKPGSGKTLTSLTIASFLISQNKNNNYTGILVLIPGNQLKKTWENEIKQHTTGYDVIFRKNSRQIIKITSNTIIISTMGNMRDYPIHHAWLLVVIDECLTVQNSNALWTEEAWKQSTMSKHLLMMSATFFRARFDKLYYMLKMLRTYLPIRKQYLDTILVESVVAQMPLQQANWYTSITRMIITDDEIRKRYDKIESSDMSSETKYAKLNEIVTKISLETNIVTDQLRELVLKLNANGHKCLIYAKSREESKLWSTKLGISIYPIIKDINVFYSQN